MLAQGFPALLLKDHKSAKAKIQGNNSNESLDGLRYFRRFLSKANISNSDIASVLSVDVLQDIEQYLVRSDTMALHAFEALWVITNIASGNREHCETILQSGLLPKIRDLLDHSDENVVDQAIWALGNIIGDGAGARDLILHTTDVLDRILLVMGNPNVSIRRNAAWALGNFFRFKPVPDVDVARRAFPSVQQRLAAETDPEAEVDLCWVISYMSDDHETSNPRIQMMVEAGIPEEMIKRVRAGTARLLSPCVRALGNIVSGTDGQTDAALKVGLIDALFPLLSSHSASLRKESCWILSNIAAGTFDQKLKLFGPEQKLDLLNTLCHLLRTDTKEVCKEIWWIVANISSGGDIQLSMLQPEKLLPAISESVDRFSSNDKIDVAATGLLQLLCSGQKDTLRIDFRLGNLLGENSMKLVSLKLGGIQASRKQVTVDLEFTNLPSDIRNMVSSFLHTVE